MRLNPAIFVVRLLGVVLYETRRHMGQTDDVHARGTQCLQRRDIAASDRAVAGTGMNQHFETGLAQCRDYSGKLVTVTVGIADGGQGSKFVDVEFRRCSMTFYRRAKPVVLPLTTLPSGPH